MLHIYTNNTETKSADIQLFFKENVFIFVYFSGAYQLGVWKFSYLQILVGMFQ